MIRLPFPVFAAVALGLTALHAAEGVKVRALPGIYQDSREGRLKGPEAVASDGAASVAVADTANGRVVLYAFEAGQATARREIRLPQITYPTQVQFVPGGDLLVLDGRTHRIVRVTASGEFKGMVEPRGDAAAGQVIVKSFKVGPGGDLYLLDLPGGRVLVLGADGASKRSIALPDDARSPADIAVDSGGTVYALESAGRRVDAARPGAAAFAPLGKPFREDAAFPAAITVGPQGLLCITDQEGHGLVFLGPDGSFRGRQSAMGWKEGFLRYPAGIAAAPAGFLLVADRDNNRVQIFQVVE